MFFIIINERDIVDYLNRYFDDADGDNYARFIQNYPAVLEDCINALR